MKVQVVLNFVFFVEIQLNFTMYANKHSRVIQLAMHRLMFYTQGHFNLDFAAFELRAETGIDM